MVAVVILIRLKFLYSVHLHVRSKIYMLFAGWEVRIVKNCDQGLANAARGRRPRAAFSSPRSQFVLGCSGMFHVPGFIDAQT